jgi:hypothetical protein
MPRTIFLSWQADTPTICGRNFLERALNTAKERLTSEELDIEPAHRGEEVVVDRDTQGEAGSPPIVETIFRKIDACSAFVADLTFVGHRLDGRPTPNPNVLIEYGWALKSRTFSRVILVMNTAYGEPSDDSLPFNLKHVRRPITYHLPAAADEPTRVAARATLVSVLQEAFRACLGIQDPGAIAPEVAKFTERNSMAPGRFCNADQSIGIIEAPFGEGHTAVRLSEGSCLWLRVMPDEAQNKQWSIAELRAAIQGPHFLYPMSVTATHQIRAADGFGTVPAMADGDAPVFAAVMLFNTGEIWSTYCGRALNGTPIPNFEDWLVSTFLRCIALLRDKLGIAPPYRWIAGIDGVRDKSLQKFAPPGRGYISPYTGPCLQNTIVESSVYTGVGKPQLALSSFFTRLYDACGYERGSHYDDALLQQFPNS